MADQGLPVDRVREDRRMSCGDVQLTAADTECAHALLDLAHSFSRTKPQTSNERAVLYPLTSNRSPPRKVTLQKVPFRKTSPMKTHKVRGMKASAGTPRDPGRVKEQETRVLLDHPYALPPWAREYPRPVDPEFFSLLDAVEGSEEGARPRDPTMPSPAPVSAGQWRGAERGKEQRENSPAPRFMNFYAERAADGRSPTPGDKQERSRGGMTERTDRRKHLYEPDDSKYKNFNLLLKCLTTGNDSPPEARSGGRKRCYSTMESDAGSASAAAERSGPREVGSSQETHCLHCKKVFSNRAYLKKHTQRMHPTKPETGRNGPSKPEPGRSGPSGGGLVTCRRCELRVDAARWSRHRIACGAGAPEYMPTPSSRDSGSRDRLLAASNQSTCQFCGLRMRRQLLVRHLADTHCLDGRTHGHAHAHMHGHPHDSANSDSGSETTLSGSEQESEDIVTCDVCLAYVPKQLLQQHVMDQHQREAPREHQRNTGSFGHNPRDRTRNSSGYGTDTRARGTSASTETGEIVPQLMTYTETSEVEIQNSQPHLETSEAAPQLMPRTKTSEAAPQLLPRVETSRVAGSGRGGLQLPGAGEPCGQYMLQRYLREHSGHTERYYEHHVSSNFSPREQQQNRQSLSPKNNLSANSPSGSGFGRYYEEVDVSSFPAELPEYARPTFLAQRPRVPSHAN